MGVKITPRHAGVDPAEENKENEIAAQGTNTEPTKEEIKQAAMTPEELEEYKQAKKTQSENYRARKQAAKQTVLDFMTKNPEVFPADVKSALDYVLGTAKRQVTGVIDELRKLFTEKGSLTAGEIFDKYELGRPSMTQKARDLIKNAATPEERLWIAYDVPSKTWEVKGKGANPPENWTGYLPPATKADLTL